jgi:DNA-binding LacI/PurR family transcriptional regulator
VTRLKRATIVDVAQRAGVSKSLVSLVMRGSPKVGEGSRRAVLQAASELGYRPNAIARSLVRRSSTVIGVVLSDLHNPYFADVADGIEEAAAEGAYRAILGAGFLEPEREAGAVETLLQLQADGLILLGPMMPLARIEAAASLVPVVVVGLETSAPTLDSVRNDDEAGAAAVVDHLVRLGHRRVVHVHAGSLGGSRARRRGYEQAMVRHGLQAYLRSVRGDFTEDGGARAMREVIAAGDLPTAVFVANDLAAMGALEALAAAGLRVPHDVSLVGYDDIITSHSARVALTTVAQPSVDIGRTASELLIERLEHGRSEARHVVLPPRLVVRGSTAAPAAR